MQQLIAALLSYLGKELCFCGQNITGTVLVEPVGPWGSPGYKPIGVLASVWPSLSSKEQTRAANDQDDRARAAGSSGRATDDTLMLVMSCSVETKTPQPVEDGDYTLTTSAGLQMA